MTYNKGNTVKMNHREKQEAIETIDRKLVVAKQMIDDCVKLAEHAGVIFHLPWGGEGTFEAGMGATYVPETASEQDKKWNLNYGDRCGWQPSAGSC